MPSTYILYSLDVGQGMATYFEYYDSGGTLRSNALFDLGSTKSSKTAGPPTLEFLKTQILKRKPPDGYIDAVFLSHKDGDHINLLGALLDLVPDAGIGLVRYGGRYNWYKNRANNILADLGARTGDPEHRLRGFPIGHSNWNPTTGFGVPIWMGTSYSAYLLAANTPYRDDVVGDPESAISNRPDGDQANSKSLVIALFMGNTLTVIGGDATFPTFQYINGFFDASFDNNVMTLLPHHGSRKTTFGLSSTNATITDEARLVVSTYARRMKGLTVVASADTKHAHPSLETIDTFVAFTDKTKSWWSDPDLTAGFHFETAYIDLTLSDTTNIPKEYTTLQTSQNIYSTLYYFNTRKVDFSYAPYAAGGKPPDTVSFPTGMNWIYTSKSGSAATTLVGVSSKRLDDTLAVLMRPDFVAGDPFPHHLLGGGDHSTTPAAAARSAATPVQRARGQARSPAQARRIAPRLSAVR